MALDELNQDDRNTYSGFVQLIKWGTILSFALGAIVVLIIGS